MVSDNQKKPLLEIQDHEPPVEMTIPEFAKAVGRSPITIRRHLQKGGPLCGRSDIHFGRHFLTEDTAAWYVNNIKRSGWDRSRKSLKEQSGNSLEE